MKKLILAALLLLPVVPAHAATTWDIGFRVTTIERTNVSVTYRLTCTKDGVSREVKQTLLTQAPLVRHLEPTLGGAERCHLRVVAWDIPPHTRPHNWPAPVVEAWAEAV